MGGQHTANKASALVCSHCFRFLGPIPAQISHCLSQLPGLGDSGRCLSSLFTALQLLTHIMHTIATCVRPCIMQGCSICK